MPINELLPKEKGYEYSSDLSLLPLRRKIQIPLRPENWKNELAIPGFARTVLNDLFLAATGPGRATAGEFTEGELAEVGMRGGNALVWGGLATSRPSGSLGSGGFFGKKPPASSANPVSTLYSESKATSIFADDPLFHFNKAYEEVVKELESTGNWKVGVSKKGQFTIFAADDAEQLLDYGKHVGEGDYIGQGLSKLNAAHAQYLKSTKLRGEPNDDDLLPEYEMPALAPKKTNFFPADVKSTLKDYESLFIIKAVDDSSPGSKGWHVETSEGDFTLQAFDDGKKVSLYSPDGGAYNFKNPSDAMDFVTEWNQYGGPGTGTSMNEKAFGGQKLAQNRLFSAELEEMPPQAMREYTPSELDWEFNNEYGKYAKSLFPKAFADRADFQRQYDAAPLRSLNKKELKNLEYATLGGLLEKGQSIEDKIAKVNAVAGHRRDVPKIMEEINSGTTAPPIVLKHETGLRLLGGNTRLMSALALGKNMPVKVIDIRSFPRRDSDKFDLTAPLTPEKRQANFNNWFAGSKVVDEDGEPMLMYHASHARDIEAFDPKKAAKESGESRDFFSFTSSPDFINNWGKRNVVYPVYVSAKNPGDFRKGDDIEKAAKWKTLEELKLTHSAAFGDPEGFARIMNGGNPDLRREYLDVLESNRHRAGTGIWTFWEDPAMWKALGWDGVFMTEHGGGRSDHLNFAAPNPGQIKSVFNKGFWNPEDERILFSSGAPIPLDLEPVDFDPFDLEPVSGNPFEEEEK